MRKLKLAEHISLDGVIQNTNDDGNFPYDDWTAPYRSPEGLKVVMEKYGARFDLLLGRRTYDLWSGYWPKVANNPFAASINAATKYVVTHRPESLAWGPVEGLSGDLVKSLKAIKEKAGPDLVLSGSSSITSLILEHGLADEVLLLIYPVLLGKGKRFLAEGIPACRFTLEESIKMPSGILINSYKVAGKLSASPNPKT